MCMGCGLNRLNLIYCSVFHSQLFLIFGTFHPLPTVPSQLSPPLFPNSRSVSFPHSHTKLPHFSSSHSVLQNKIVLDRKRKFLQRTFLMSANWVYFGTPSTACGHVSVWLLDPLSEMQLQMTWNWLWNKYKAIFNFFYKQHYIKSYPPKSCRAISQLHNLFRCGERD